MDILLVLPLLLPLGAACLCMMVIRRPRWGGIITVANALGLLGVAIVILVQVWQEGVLVTRPGSWPPPYGITLVADMFSAIMVLLGAIIAVCVCFYAAVTIDRRRAVYGFFPLVNILLLGVMGAFLTGDLFNLYVWFEVLLISSFVLLGLGGTRGQMEGAIKYVTLNLLSSSFFLTGLGLLYGATGSLNMADLAVRLDELDDESLVVTISMLFLVAFGLKSAVFPFFSWLPASYHTPPLAVSALFAGLLTKVGVYAMIRVFSLIFSGDTEYIQDLLLWIAGFTMVTGVIGAAAQDEFRRILSFHIVSQVGYMVMGLAFFTPLGLAAAVYYIGYHMFAKTGLFLVAGITQHLMGSYDLKKLGGMIKASPELSIVFFCCAFSLAGIPPLAGFFGKFGLVQAGLDGGFYAVVAASLVVSVLTMYSMTKIWAEVFWKPFPGELREDLPALRRSPRVLAMMAPAAAFAALSIGTGVAAGPAFELATVAGEQLADPTAYISAVLGEEAP